MTEVISRMSCDESSSHAMPSSHGIMSTAHGTDSAATMSKQIDFGELSKTTFSSANESKIPKRTTSTSSTQSKNSNMRSPRCEAFLMTGDKMLNLNTKISPHYAKVYQEQLPPSVEVYDGNSFESTKMKKCGGPFDDFPSMHNPTRRSGIIKKKDIIDVNYSTSDNYIVHDAVESLADDNDVNLATASKFSAGENVMTKNNNYSINYSHDNEGTVPSTRPCDTTVTSSTSCHSASSSPIKNNNSSQNDEQNENTSAGCRRRLVGVEGVIDHRFGTTLSREESTASSRSADPVQPLDSGLPKPATISRIVIQMFTLQAGFSPTDVATNLMKKDELSERIAAEFLQHFHFSGKRIDAALREFLNHVCLTGESSERAHLLLRFSTQYFECNPTLFSDINEIHALACALILLNTDLHGPNLGKKMTMREFVDNLLHVRCAYDRNMLKTLYNAVNDAPFKREVLQPATTDTVAALNDAMTTESGFASVSERKKMMNGGGGGTSSALLRDPMAPSSLIMVDPNEQVDYRHGWVLKKSTYDSDGLRTPFGRRKWQMCYATIRGMVLYLHKNEKVFETSRRHETFANCIRLHHAVAEVADDYTKRPHVFRLRTANLGELLFQTSDAMEVQKWIDAINYVAAVFSTPVLPAPVSSADTERGANNTAAFVALCARHRQLPVASTSLSITEQLKSHREHLEEVIDILAKLRAVAPPINAKGKAVYEYFYRERLMDKERERYVVYVSILNEKLGVVTDVAVDVNVNYNGDRRVNGRSPIISSSSCIAPTPSKSCAFVGNTATAAADSQSMTSCSTALALNNTRVAAAICCQQQPTEPACWPPPSTNCCHHQKSVESGSCGGIPSILYHHHHHFPRTSQLKQQCIHSLHYHQQQCCLAAGNLVLPTHHHLPQQQLSQCCCGGGTAIDGGDIATTSANNITSQATPSESFDNLPTPSYFGGCCCYNNYYSRNIIDATNRACTPYVNAGGSGGCCFVAATTATASTNATIATASNEGPTSDVEQQPPI